MKNITPNEKKYLPEIDGIRAIAVISVIFFHFHIPFFSGGYVGVDVFFVISGYLITGLILRQLTQKTFSFTQFYLRRLRRLFPAILTVSIVSFIVSFFLLSPSDLERFSGAVVSSLVSVSNVFFFFESGYFDTDSYLKPMLHTWSLGVEEQFYMVWPLLLFLFRIKPLIIIIILTLVSLVVSIITIENYPSANFYLMPFRIFEFGIGAIVCWIPQLKKPGKSIDLVAIIGILLILYSVFNFNESTIFPAVNALFPCLGAALLIISRKSYIIGQILRSKISTHIGKISYSLYLVHWPIVVYYKYYMVSTKNSFSIFEIIFLLVNTYIFAFLLNKFVENKYRYGSLNKKINSTFWYFLVSISLVLIVLASSSWVNKGWPWRTGHDIQNIVSTIPNLQKDRLKKINELNNKPLIKGQKNIVILGDSHANDLLISFSNESKFNFIRIPIPYRCQPVLKNRLIEKGYYRLVVTSQAEDEKCTKIIKSKLNNKQLFNADIILISARWKSWAVEKLPEFIDYLRKITNAEIVIFGPTIEFKRPLPYLINKHNQLYGLEQFVYEHEDRSKREISKNLQIVAQSLNIPYVDKFKVLCGNINNDCPVILPEGGILTWDYGHWTIETSKLFEKNLKTSYPEIAKILL